MPELLIRLKRATDGSAALTCVRADGSRTWQRQPGSRGMVLPAHDLTHYAVETSLGYRRGFFGLVAEGWDISDFASPWPRGPIPDEAREVELLVGVFDIERRTGERWTAEQLREQAALYLAANPRGYAASMPPSLTDDDVARVRAARADAFARWADVEPGGTLELTFTRSSPAP